MTERERPQRQFSEGQVFIGHAFGQLITVTLDSPEWVDYAGAPPFWAWQITTHLGGGGSLSERVLSAEFTALGDAS